MGLIIMEIGFIGLGRMGSNMVNRILEKGGIRVVAWNRSREKVDQVAAKGAVGADSIKDLIDKLKQDKKIVWLMLPSGEVTENAFVEALGYLKQGDIIIDGANSNFHDTLRHHKMAEEKGIEMLDVGVSGGIIAAKTGYSMMVGAEKKTWDYVKPIFDAFGIDGGYDLMGPGGSGHYVKMVHNAIEYGMMQAIAEGFDLLNNGEFKGKLDLLQISKLWNHGTIVESLLMKMTQQALEKDKKLELLAPHVDESGEGRWAAVEAIDKKVPFVVNSYAVHARYISKDTNSLAFRMLAAMREQFGGHAVKKV